LLKKEIELASQQVNDVAERHKNGIAGNEAVIERQKELAGLQRELARLQNDLPAFETAINQQLALVKQLQDAHQQRVAVGVDTGDSLLDLRREVLRLQRELAAQRNSVTLNKNAPDATARENAEKDRAAQLQELRAQLDTLRGTYGEQHPAIRSVRDRIEKISAAGGPARRELTISAPRAGVITRVLIEEGAQIKKGQRLIEFDSREEETRLGRARAQLQGAQADLKVQEITAKKATLDYDRAKELGSQKLISQEELASKEQSVALAQANVTKAAAALVSTEHELRQAELDMEMRTIAAPRDGTVMALPAQEGAYVSVKDPLLTIGK
jgi:multidrug resistance efflux pump